MPACTSSFIPRLDGHVPLDEDEFVELWHVLSTVPDPRDPRGVRHAFATILTLAIGAVLAGCRSVAAITAWTVDLPPWTAHRLGVRRRPPALSTISRTLIAVDPDVLDAVLGAWLATRTCAPAGMRALAVDGKTARGARRPDGTQVHLVAALDHATGTVLGQVEVTSKGSEIAAFTAVLDRVDLHGCIVTADALHTQTAHAHYLHHHGGHYVLTVKGNQPRLRARCAGLPWSQVQPGHVEHAAGHGRREQRTIQVITAVHPALPFPHARQVARIVRQRRHGPTGRERMQVEFVITDLTTEQADPAQLAALVRGHWGIENRLHWVRDVTFAEDHSALRTGHAATVMATLRNTAISLLRLAGHQNIAATAAANGRRPERILQLIERSDQQETSREGRL
jgi:predicted transposase YbfD/YdcC